MRLLLDNCVDVDFEPLIEGHEVNHALDLGWDQLSNGKLLAVADEAGFDALVTVDKNLRFQQSLNGLKLSVITLLPRFVLLQYIAPLVPKVLQALEDLPHGTFVTIEPD